jgi:Protein of unknown function (DUF2842)
MTPRFSYKTRRRLSFLALLVWLPLYIVVAVNVMNWLGRPGILVELLIYVGLGFLWMLPLRQVFLGVGRADPDTPSSEDER